MKEFKLEVDFSKGVRYRLASFVKGDTGYCSIILEIAQTLTDERVFVTFELPSGSRYILEAEKDGNTATLLLPSGVLSEAGKVNCQVALHSPTGRLTNPVGFYYRVVDDLSQGAVEASDQYPILTQLIENCREILAEDIDGGAF